MPLTLFQKEVLETIVTNRSDLSHFAGGIVLHAPAESARFSKDFDLFHEAVEDLVASSERDVSALSAAGYTVDFINHEECWKNPSTFRKAPDFQGRRICGDRLGAGFGVAIFSDCPR